MHWIEELLEAIKRSPRSERDISIAAVGHGGAIRNLRSNGDMRVSTLEALCRELDQEFYVGPRRPAVPQDVTQALDLGGDCDIATAVDAITSLSNTMGAVRARGEALIKADIQRGGEALGRELERFNQLHKGLEARQQGLLPVALAGVDATAGAARARFYEMRMSIAFPVRLIPDWAKHLSLVFMRAVGDSLAPDLGDGQMVLLDRSKTKPVQGIPFLLHSVDGFAVRSFLSIEGRWMAWIDESNPDRMLDLERDQVIGGVAWTGFEDPVCLDSDCAPIE